MNGSDRENDARENEGHRSIRNVSIRRAISTSLASKVSTAVLQFVSLPVAARAMGREEFGIYATVSTAVLLVLILQMGVGPALARGISSAAARRDRDREALFFWNGAFLVGLLVFLGMVIGAVFVLYVPIPLLFGEEYRGWEPEMKSGIWTGLVLIGGLLLVSHTDRVREGYMEAYTVNAWGAFGNLVGAAAVFVGVRYFPSVPFLLLAIYCPNVLARVANSVFLLRDRRYLLKRENVRFDRSTIRELVGDGVSFSATTFFVYVVEFGLCGLLIGRLAGPGEVAVFQVLMTVTTSFEGLLTMVGTPVWAALADAKEKNDISWMKDSIQRYYRYLFLLTVAVGLGEIALGPILFPWWYGEEFSVGRAVFAGHALFLAALGWREVNRFITVGLGLLPKTVWPILGGAAAGLILGVPGMHLFGMSALFIGLGVGALFVPGLILPIQIRKVLMQGLQKESEAHPSVDSSLTQATSPSALRQ
ncbi:MAG: hypothetical protein CMO55_23995 [Verrucomicrobiales bacterium]|nr:hypothetical protein [Verrucomicrobiales bacterium]